jgi:hypothetical protein
MTRFGRRGLIAAVAAVALAVSVGATALAVTTHSGDRNNRGSAGAVSAGRITTAVAPPATHHWSVAASAFAPDQLYPGSSDDYFNQWDPAKLTDPGGRCFNAGVYLPNGATIKSVTFYYTNGATTNFYGELNRQNLPTHKSAQLVSFTSTPTGTSPVYTHKTFTVAGGGLVDTSRFAYGLGACPEGDSAFSGVTINYTG